MYKRQAYHWPGNVRELRNAVQRAYVMAGEELIDDQWLPEPTPGLAGTAEPAVPAATPVSAAEAAERISLRIGTSMAEAEKALILATFKHYGQHKERTAAVLGISLKTLYNRLKEYQAENGGDGKAA